MAKGLWIWKDQWVEFGFIRILLWLSHQSTSSWPQDEENLWLSVLMSNSLKNSLSIFHRALFDLNLLWWSPLFKKIVSQRFPVIILHVQCEPLRDLNPGHIFRDNGKLQLECWKIPLEIVCSEHISIEIPFLLVCHHFFTFFHGTRTIRSLWQELREEAILGIQYLLEGSFSDEGSSKYPWWYAVSSDIRERKVVLFCWAKHSKYFKSFQVNIVLLFYS